jgi:hypothetical protein
MTLTGYSSNLSVTGLPVNKLYPAYLYDIC